MSIFPDSVGIACVTLDLVVETAGQSLLAYCAALDDF